jgi:hypothetical protein
MLGFWLLGTAPSLLIVSLPIPDGRSSLKLSHGHLCKVILIEVMHKISRWLISYVLDFTGTTKQSACSVRCYNGKAFHLLV